MATATHSHRARSRVGARTRIKLKKWSGKVTRESNSLDLQGGVFKKRRARDIALSLKRSAERSRRRKAPPLRSAISMLTFYINRAGKSLSTSRRHTLEAAKGELRRLFKAKKAA